MTIVNRADVADVTMGPVSASTASADVMYRRRLTRVAVRQPNFGEVAQVPGDSHHLIVYLVGRVSAEMRRVVEQGRPRFRVDLGRCAYKRTRLEWVANRLIEQPRVLAASPARRASGVLVWTENQRLLDSWNPMKLLDTTRLRCWFAAEASRTSDAMLRSTCVGSIPTPPKGALIGSASRCCPGGSCLSVRRRTSGGDHIGFTRRGQSPERRRPGGR